ncbi:MAG: ABC transporter substrate-binding protein, partial [Deltaproteobacteria bacterium]|nr:ABC transporter substrate-binding protein [Deltaproteobacteria bacterium]
MKRFALGKLLVVLILGITLIVLGAKGARADEKGPVRFGSLVMLTGFLATPGLDMQRGEQIAVEEINKAGGVLGRKLELIYEDTESTSEKAVEAVRKLIDINKVKIIIGTYSSWAGLATGEITNKRHILQVAVAPTSPQMRKVGPYFFNMSATDDVLAPKLARGAFKVTGAKRWGSIIQNDPFGIGIEVYTCKTVKELGGECVTKVRFEHGEKDFRPELQRLFSAKPEAVFFTSQGEDAKLLLKQIYELGLKPPKGFWADYMTMWSSDAIPETAEGIRGWVAGAEAAPDYVNRYREKYGEPPLTVWGSYAYDAVWTVSMAVNYAHTTDPEVLKDVLPLVVKRYKGVTGDKTFDKDGMQADEEIRWMIYHDG